MSTTSTQASATASIASLSGPVKAKELGDYITQYANQHKLNLAKLTAFKEQMQKLEKFEKDYREVCRELDKERSSKQSVQDKSRNQIQKLEAELERERTAKKSLQESSASQVKVLENQAKYLEGELEKERSTKQSFQDKLKSQIKSLENEAKTHETQKKGLETKIATNEKVVNDNSYALVLIDSDGDGYMMDKYLQSDPVDGGKNTAIELRNAVRQYLQECPGENIGDLPIIVQAFASGNGRVNVLTKKSELSRSQAQDNFMNFISGFSQTEDLFDFVLVGRGKDRADLKLSASFRHHVRNPCCQRILLACCHDNGYVRMLEKYTGDAAVKKKVILVKSVQTGAEFIPLPFSSTTLGGFFKQRPLPPPSTGLRTETAGSGISAVSAASAASAASTMSAIHVPPADTLVSTANGAPFTPQTVVTAAVTAAPAVTAGGAAVPDTAPAPAPAPAPTSSHSHMPFPTRSLTSGKAWLSHLLSFDRKAAKSLKSSSRSASKASSIVSPRVSAHNISHHGAPNITSAPRASNLSIAQHATPLTPQVATTTATATAAPTPTTTVTPPTPPNAAPVIPNGVKEGNGINGVNGVNGVNGAPPPLPARRIPLPTFGTLPEWIVFVNAQDQRLDPPLPEISQSVKDSMGKRMRKPLCHQHQFKGNCERPNCEYSHEKVSPEELLYLRQILRASRCNNESGCRDPYCFYGHSCTCPQTKKCDFTPELHNLDTSTWKPL